MQTVYQTISIRPRWEAGAGAADGVGRAGRAAPGPVQPAAQPLGALLGCGGQFGRSGHGGDLLRGVAVVRLNL